MAIASTPPTVDRLHGPAARPEAAYDRTFWIGLGVALLAHGLLFIGPLRAPPRQIGDPGGSQDGINVELVDAAELFGSSAPAAPPPGASPSPQSASRPPPASAPPPPETATAASQRADAPLEPAERPARAPAAEPPPDELPALTALRPSTAEEQPQQPAAQKQERRTAEAVEKQRPDLLVVPKESREALPPQRKPSPTTPKQERPKQERQKQASLDLSPPSAPMQPSFSGAAGAAGVSRPAGITRSGENDDFARRVVRALREVMPQVNIRGRVTVRLVISEQGNLQNVQLLGSSGDAQLSHYVVFSTRQANFPLPPARSLEVDRIFQVTYIYN